MGKQGFSIESSKFNLNYEQILDVIPGDADIFLIEDSNTGKYAIMICPEEAQGAGLPYYTSILLDVINLIGDMNIFGYRYQKNNPFGGGDILVILNINIDE